MIQVSGTEGVGGVRSVEWEWTTDVFLFCLHFLGRFLLLPLSAYFLVFSTHYSSYN